jgi:hypothetical protein
VRNWVDRWQQNDLYSAVMKTFLKCFLMLAGVSALFAVMAIPAEAARGGRPPTVIILDPGSPLSPP